MVELTDRGLKYLEDLLTQKTGIDLSSKRTHLESKLCKRLRELNMQDLDQYAKYIQRNPDEMQKAIDDVTINLTFFFRESTHFRYLEHVFDISKRLDNMKIWSAACSTGEEAYSIAMLAHNWKGDSNIGNLKVLGTDINMTVLQHAKTGIYKQDQVMRTPQEYKYCLDKYLMSQGNGRYAVSDAVRDCTMFRKFNLLNPLPFQRESIDIIFCRNVFIYFDVQTRHTILDKMHSALKQGGYLFLGLSEPLLETERTEHRFRRYHHSVYQRV